MIETPSMLIFTNAGNTYPICGLEDDILGITYRIGRKDWMDQHLFPKYILEPHTFQSNVHNRTKFFWLDNCTSYNIILRLAIVLEEKICVLKYLPA